MSDHAPYLDLPDSIHGINRHTPGSVSSPQRREACTNPICGQINYCAHDSYHIIISQQTFIDCLLCLK